MLPIVKNRIFIGMNLKESIKRILKEENNILKLSSYLEVEPFYKLPYKYKKSLMIFRNEGVVNDEDIKELITDELKTKFKYKSFYIQFFPLNVLTYRITSPIAFLNSTGIFFFFPIIYYY